MGQVNRAGFEVSQQDKRRRRGYSVYNTVQQNTIVVVDICIASSL